MSGIRSAWLCRKGGRKPSACQGPLSAALGWCSPRVSDLTACPRLQKRLGLGALASAPQVCALTWKDVLTLFFMSLDHKSPPLNHGTGFLKCLGFPSRTGLRPSKGWVGKSLGQPSSCSERCCFFICPRSQQQNINVDVVDRSAGNRCMVSRGLTNGVWSTGRGDGRGLVWAPGLLLVRQSGEGVAWNGGGASHWAGRGQVCMGRVLHWMGGLNLGVEPGDSGLPWVRPLAHL